MPGVARIGDPISHGGAITSGSLKVLANGLGVARIGDSALCDIHGTTTIVSGSVKVFAEGLGVARIGDVTACGAVISGGSLNVLAN